MEKFSLAQKIQIGLLGLIAVLLVLQLSGVFSSGDSAVREQAASEILGNTAAPANGVQNMPNGMPNGMQNPAQPAIQPNQPIQPTTPPVPTGPKTNIAVTKDLWDFGTIKAGETVEHVYKFKNTGNDPLIISNASGSCGCTVPQWPREPIAPGKTGEIKVVYNSTGKSGKINQTVTLTANTEPATTTLRVAGEVIGDKAAAGTTTPIQVNPTGGQ
jgi:hypothetical protein